MQQQLRNAAVERIKKGTAPVTRGWPAGTEALAMLHRLASAPASASDALKLLHELQVHQVELDLQHEQAEQDRQQVTDDLAQYTALFDAAPFAYLALAPDGVVVAANRIAADWLAPPPGQACTGRHIDELLAPDSRGAVRDMLAALRQGATRHTGTLQARAGGDSTQAVATVAPGGQVLLAAVPAGAAPAAAAP